MWGRYRVVRNVPLRGTGEHRQNERDNVRGAHVEGLPRRGLTELGGGGGGCGRQKGGQSGFCEQKGEFGFYSECERKSAEDAKCITLSVLVIVRFLLHVRRKICERLLQGPSPEALALGRMTGSP